LEGAKLSKAPELHEDIEAIGQLRLSVRHPQKESEDCVELARGARSRMAAGLTK
jgi:hypothetical protein